MNSPDFSDSQAHAASSDHAAPAPATLLSMLALLAMGALCLLAPREALAQADKPAAGLDLQHARAQFVEAKGFSRGEQAKSAHRQQGQYRKQRGRGRCGMIARGGMRLTVGNVG